MTMSFWFRNSLLGLAASWSEFLNHALADQLTTIRVRRVSRASRRSIAPRVIAMHPAVGAKPGRARCRKTALPRPLDPRSCVVVDLDDEVVEMIGAHQPIGVALAASWTGRL